MKLRKDEITVTKEALSNISNAILITTYEARCAAYSLREVIKELDKIEEELDVIRVDSTDMAQYRMDSENLRSQRNTYKSILKTAIDEYKEVLSPNFPELSDTDGLYIALTYLVIDNAMDMIDFNEHVFEFTHLQK